MSGDEGLYTPTDLARIGFDPARDLGAPGEYPSTRGIYPSMYRGRLWTMRQYAGAHATAEETNQSLPLPPRARAQTGLSTSPSTSPPSTGYDSRTIPAPPARSARPACSISLAPRTTAALFDGIPLEQASPVPTPSTRPAAVILAHVRGRWRSARGCRWIASPAAPRTTSSRSSSPEARYIFPPVPSLRLVTGHHRVLRRPPAALELHQRVRLPHA